MSLRSGSGRLSRRRRERRLNPLEERRLNLTSMTDFFTVLVTILLVYSLNIQLLPPPGNIHLPLSTARKDARKAVVVMLTDDRILVGGKPVISYKQVMANGQNTIPVLAAAMKARLEKPTTTPSASQKPAAQPQANASGNTATAKQAPTKNRGRLTIMADKKLPYRLIRKVMLTGTAVGFTHISLAVLQSNGQLHP